MANAKSKVIDAFNDAPALSGSESSDDKIDPAAAGPAQPLDIPAGKPRDSISGMTAHEAKGLSVAAEKKEKVAAAQARAEERRRGGAGKVGTREKVEG